jgi:hypothetical protein
LLPDEDFQQLRQVFAAGGGAMTLIVINQRSAVSIVADAMAGDAVARVVLSAADQLLRRIERRTRTMALPCLLCDDGMLWRGEAPAAVAVLLPYGVDHVRAALGMAICENCAGELSNSATAQAVVVKLRAGMLPDLRVLPAMAQIGHA